MAASLNGMIAKEDDDASWILKGSWNSYSETIRKAGNIILGRRTYEIIAKNPEEIAGLKVVVVSQKNFETLSPNHLIAASPKAALELLKDFPEIIVAGGGGLNSAFLQENLVDEIFLDIEPIAFAPGIPLFKDGNFDRKLKLLGTKKISDDEIQLHYKVIK